MPAQFGYSRSDFSPAPVDVIHLDLTFDIHDTETNVSAESLFRTKDQPIRSIRLNATDLEVRSISCRGRWCDYTVEEDGILISFKNDIPPQTGFIILTDTICRPGSTLLLGLYYDDTPAGAPPTQITQCQQWGFRRLVPCIDEMTAKSTYRTTIIADSRYTHLISNGDIAVSRHEIAPGRDAITYDNSKTPMAPYLFFLGVGTYDSFQRIFEYPSGPSFLLEILCPPGSDPIRASQAQDILEDCILWVYLFTGPHQYEQIEIRHEIYRLFWKRAQLRTRGADDADMKPIAEKMQSLDEKILCGYTYTGSVYREIGMQNSDFGGMENVGNTTIMTNRLMPFAGMTDPGFEYLLCVKVHEYYHNVNGSEVTGSTPFEIWLNEAVTVHIERQYHAFHFGEDYSRLKTLLSLLDPADGTFARDTGAAAMPIEPEGFNDPDDLITPVTYVKAPEFVRMVEKVLGREPFVWALSIYHRRFAHANASTGDWVGVMSAIAGFDLMPMATGWLKRSGFPTVAIQTEYSPDQRLCRVCLRQSGGDPPWIFPFDLALMTAEGSIIASRCHLVTGTKESIVFEDVDLPAYYSFNRGFSCYCLLDYHPDEDALYLQARTDPDITGRFIAYQALASRELARLMQDTEAHPSQLFLSLYMDLLTDAELMEGAGAQFLTIIDDPGDPALAHRYRAVYSARLRLEHAIAKAEAPMLYALYRAYHRTEQKWQSIGGLAAYIRNRQVKNHCLRLLSLLDTDMAHDLINDQFSHPKASATDRMHAYGLILGSSAPNRLGIFSDMMEKSGSDPVLWEQFLSATAGSDAGDIVSLLRAIEDFGYFRIEQAADQRALYGRFARNRKCSLETEEGRQFFSDALFRLMKVNEYTTSGLLATFSHIDRMDPRFHIPLLEILASLYQETAASYPGTALTLKRIIMGNPIAQEAYEREKGQIPGFRA